MSIKHIGEIHFRDTWYGLSSFTCIQRAMKKAIYGGKMVR